MDAELDTQALELRSLEEVAVAARTAVEESNRWAPPNVEMGPPPPRPEEPKPPPSTNLRGQEALDARQAALKEQRAAHAAAMSQYQHDLFDYNNQLQAKTIEAEHAQYQQRKALGQEVRTAEEAMRNATQQLKEATGKRHEFEVSALEAMAEDSKDRMLESESKLEETTDTALAIHVIARQHLIDEPLLVPMRARLTEVVHAAEERLGSILADHRAAFHEVEALELELKQISSTKEENETNRELLELQEKNIERSAILEEVLDHKAGLLDMEMAEISNRSRARRQFESGESALKDTRKALRRKVISQRNRYNSLKADTKREFTEYIQEREDANQKRAESRGRIVVIYDIDIRVFEIALKAVHSSHALCQMHLAFAKSLTNQEAILKEATEYFGRKTKQKEFSEQQLKSKITKREEEQAARDQEAKVGTEKVQAETVAHARMMLSETHGYLTEKVSVLSQTAASAEADEEGAIAKAASLRERAIRLRGLGDKKGAQRQEDEAAAASAASEAYRAFGRKLAERLAAMQQVLQEHDALVEESRTSGSCEVEAPWVVAALELQHRDVDSDPEEEEERATLKTMGRRVSAFTRTLAMTKKNIAAPAEEAAVDPQAVNGPVEPSAQAVQAVGESDDGKDTSALTVFPGSQEESAPTTEAPIEGGRTAIASRIVSRPSIRFAEDTKEAAPRKANDPVPGMAQMATMANSSMLITPDMA